MFCARARVAGNVYIPYSNRHVRPPILDNVIVFCRHWKKTCAYPNVAVVSRLVLSRVASLCCCFADASARQYRTPVEKHQDREMERLLDAVVKVSKPATARKQHSGAPLIIEYSDGVYVFLFPLSVFLSLRARACETRHNQCNRFTEREGGLRPKLPLLSSCLQLYETVKLSTLVRSLAIWKDTAEHASC